VRRVVVPSLIVGVLALALTVLGGLAGNSAGFFRAYLFGYTVWVGLGLGSLGVVLVQFLTGGNWGLVTRRIFEAAAATLPLMAILFVPLLFGLNTLYAWAQPAAVATDAILQHKASYLNVPFFITRTVIYLAIWIALVFLLRRWSTAQDRSADPEALHRLQRFSVVAILVLALTVTFAAIDWLMSLDADWYSTMYPPMVGAGDMLLALSFGIIVVTLVAPVSTIGETLTPRIFNDLGSLLLAFLMLWAYMSYFQYLLIWAGNLSDEIPWYLRRVEGGWLSVALVLAGLGFAVPFWFLLFRPIKRNRRTLRLVAALIVVMHLVNVYWLVVPPFEPGGPVFEWLPVAALVGLGGLWLAVFSWELGARPLLPPNDPRLPRVLEDAREPA
jgi:hypothetical protein